MLERFRDGPEAQISVRGLCDVQITFSRRLQNSSTVPDLKYSKNYQRGANTFGQAVVRMFCLCFHGI